MEGMININNEGFNNNENELTLDQENNLVLHEYISLREKAKLALLNIENLDDSLEVKMLKEKLLKEIEGLDKKIEEMGGEKEVSA